MQFRVEPRDVPTEAAAKRLGLSRAEFDEKLPRLLARGFPPADPDTGRFDLDAIDEWRRRRHPMLFARAAPPAAVDARDVVPGRLARMRHGQG